MNIRPALLSELDVIMPLYDQGRAFMRKSGNQNQWIHGYPKREMVADDIRQGHLFLAEEAGETAAVFCFFYGEDVEPTYRVIDGAWTAEGPYGVIHRIASTGKFPRMVEVCTDWCLDQCPSLKIDTHRDNVPMRAALERCGFSYCGVIVIDDGSERVAYQKVKKIFPGGEGL